MMALAFIADPAMVWLPALMLDFLGRVQGICSVAHDAILTAIETVLNQDQRTHDLSGDASTTTMGQALAAQIAS